MVIRLKYDVGIRGRRCGVLAAYLLVVPTLCGACNSGTPTRPGPALAPPPSPSPAPAPVPAVPHRVEFVYEPDWDGTPAPRDSDGAYLLDWAAGWYCGFLHNIPETPPGHCREYTFSFTWAPDDLLLTQSASSDTLRNGCKTFPSRIAPGACFKSPSRNHVSPLQSIGIVGRERMPNGDELEVFRTELAIRFRDR